MDPETLASFVDGALSPEESAKVVLHLADCAADRRFVDALMETNALLAAAYARPLHEPAPERLRAAIFPPQRPAASTPPAGAGWRRIVAGRATRRGAVLAAVACWAAVTVVAIWPDRGPVAPVGTVADATLDAALETRASGEVVTADGGVEIQVIATFLDRDGRPCRAFEVLDLGAEALTEGLACRAAPEGWATEVVLANRISPPPGAAGQGDVFVPASGAADHALDDALDRLGAGMSLTPAEERTLIAAGWTD